MSNRTAAVFAMLAITLHFAMPVVHDLAGPAAQGLISTVICSGGEQKSIFFDQDGNPVKPSPASKHDCHGCAFNAISMASAPVETSPPVWVHLFPAFHSASHIEARLAGSAEARAPPA